MDGRLNSFEKLEDRVNGRWWIVDPAKMTTTKTTVW